MSARATVTILQQVTGISVYKEDGKTRLKTLHTPAETDVQLSAGATYYGSAVLCAPGSFTWEVTGGIGTISESGKFTSANVTKLTEGTIEVSYGETDRLHPRHRQPGESVLRHEGSLGRNLYQRSLL